MLNLASISFSLGSDLWNGVEWFPSCWRASPPKPCVLQGHHKLSKSNAVNSVGLLATKHLEQHVLDVEERGLLVALLPPQHHCILVLTVVLHGVGWPGNWFSIRIKNASRRHPFLKVEQLFEKLNEAKYKSVGCFRKEYPTGEIWFRGSKCHIVGGGKDHAADWNSWLTCRTRPSWPGPKKMER